MADQPTKPTEDELWTRAKANTENRAKAMALSTSYSSFFRYWREIEQLEAGSTKGPIKELEVLRTLIEPMARRRDALNAYVIQAEDEYDAIMRQLDYEHIRG